MSNADLILYTV